MTGAEIGRPIEILLAGPQSRRVPQKSGGGPSEGLTLRRPIRLVSLRLVGMRLTPTRVCGGDGGGLNYTWGRSWQS